jgi:hypothetical protein
VYEKYTVLVKIFCKKLCIPQDCYVFGLCPSSGILKKTKEYILETGAVPILR